MEVDGSCHCGAITYAATIDPANVGICHCTDCQQLTGTAFRVTCSAAESDFRINSGAPRMYLKTTADSGNPRAQFFCGDCGSHLWVTGVGDGPKTYGIRVGTLRQRSELRPMRQVWHRSALDWLAQIPNLPATE